MVTPAVLEKVADNIIGDNVSPIDCKTTKALALGMCMAKAITEIVEDGEFISIEELFLNNEDDGYTVDSCSDEVSAN